VTKGKRERSKGKKERAREREEQGQEQSEEQGQEKSKSKRDARAREKQGQERSKSKREAKGREKQGQAREREARATEKRDIHLNRVPGEQKPTSTTQARANNKHKLWLPAVSPGNNILFPGDTAAKSEGGKSEPTKTAARRQRRLKAWLLKTLGGTTLASLYSRPLLQNFGGDLESIVAAMQPQSTCRRQGIIDRVCPKFFSLIGATKMSHKVLFVNALHHWPKWPELGNDIRTSKAVICTRSVIKLGACRDQ